MNEIFSALTVLDGTTEIWKLLIRLGFSILAGFLLGLEYKSRSKDAGVKTHTILCMTACLIMIISKYGFYELAKFEGIQYDASRVASTIISGLCFLGSGMLFFKQDSIKGLTSAVGMCLTIAIGMCFGSGLMVIGGIVTILALILQFIFHQEFGVFKSNNQLLVNVKFVLEDDSIEYVKNIFGIKKFLNIKVSIEDGCKVVEADFYYKVNASNEEIINLAKNEDKILMIKVY